MRKMNKKGFTIVELVIVIAVIAILAAVLIPTYSSLVKKANESADIQAVRQMNTILATYTDGSIENVRDAIEALDEENIDLENYTPMTKDTYFYFYIENGTPKIVYMDKAGKAIYPTDANTSNMQLMSLSGDTPVDSSWYDKKEVEGNTVKVSIANGAQMADLMNNISKLTANTQITKIEITLTDDIDMMGSSASFGDVEKNIVLDGGDHTISGLRVDRNSVNGSWNGDPRKQGFALFNKVSNASVDVKNLKIKDFVVGNTDESGIMSGHCAVLFGNITKATVTVEDVTIDNCIVVGNGKVGSIIGYVSNDSETKVSLKNVTVTNTALYGSSFIAKAIGFVACDSEKTNCTVTFESCGFNDVSVGINETDWRLGWETDGKPDKNWEDKAVIPADIITHSNGDKFVPYMNGKNEDIMGATTDNWYWTGIRSTVKVEDKKVKLNDSGSANITPDT